MVISKVVCERKCVLGIFSETVGTPKVLIRSGTSGLFKSKVGRLIPAYSKLSNPNLKLIFDILHVESFF